MTAMNVGQMRLEVFTSSPYIFNGYWQKGNSDAFDGEWLTVGDLAKKDEDGFLYIVDRKTDMIISGGINIYQEIEEILLEHPEINDIAIVGEPDEKWGEIIKAFIVFKEEELSLDEIQDFCSNKIASIKIPKIIETIDTLPRNANGKVLKTKLEQKHESEKISIDFYFDYSCPWTSWLQTFNQTATRTASDIIWKPINLEIMKEILDKPKANTTDYQKNYRKKDLQDWANYCTVVINQMENIDHSVSMAASRGVLMLKMRVL